MTKTTEFDPTPYEVLTASFINGAMASKGDIVYLRVGVKPGKYLREYKGPLENGVTPARVASARAATAPITRQELPPHVAPVSGQPVHQRPISQANPQTAAREAATKGHQRPAGVQAGAKAGSTLPGASTASPDAAAGEVTSKPVDNTRRPAGAAAKLAGAGNAAPATGPAKTGAGDPVTGKHVSDKDSDQTI